MQEWKRMIFESLQAEFALCRESATGAVARAVVEPSRDIEGLPLQDASRRRRNSAFEPREAGLAV